MRTISLLCFALLALRGCDLGEEVPLEQVAIKFTLANTLGWEGATSFTIGDDFDVIFTITNNTGRDLTFHHTGPPVIFRLESDAGVVASSIDGLVWTQVVLEGKLANGETYSTTWRAPNTPWSGKRIILLPGVYRATVRAGCFFDQFKIQAIPPIVFDVAPHGV